VLRRQRDEVQDHDHRLRIVCETVHDALIVVDDARRFLRINDQGVELLRAPADEVLRRRLEHFSPPELLPTLEWLWETSRRPGTLDGTYEVLRGDGSRALVEYRATHNFGAGQHLIAAREVRRPSVRTRRQARGPLSAREIEVLQVASTGMSAADIGEALVISPATVKSHLSNAYAKLDVADRTAAVAECLRRGFIQ
jgi:PAS domain S-box-containing protein